MKAYIDAEGMKHGYTVTSTHGDDKKNGKLKLACDRAAKYSNPSGIPENEKLKKKSSRKCGCRMYILAKKCSNDRWELMIKYGRHNHEPSQNMATHPTLRRLNADTLDQIATMATNKVPPRAQTATIRDKFPLMQRQDIYNANQKIRKQKLAGRTPIQALLDELSEKNYFFKVLILFLYQVARYANLH